MDNSAELDSASPVFKASRQRNDSPLGDSSDRLTQTEFDPASYSDWKPLSTAGLPHCYRATRKFDGTSVEILFFPAIATKQLPLDELRQQVRLFETVLPGLSQFECVSLHSPTPCIVRRTADEVSASQFLESAQPRVALSFISQLLHTINQASRSRLYHGNINRYSIAVKLNQQPTPALNFLHRFCLAGAEMKRMSDSELYTRDVKGVIDVCAEIIELLFGFAESPTLNDTPASQGRLSAHDNVTGNRALLEPRHVAILRKLCREGSRVENLNEVLDEWLTLFDEFKLAFDQAPEFQSASMGETAELQVSPANSVQADDSGTAVINVEPISLPNASTFALAPGTQFGRYSIVDLLGRGGMGAVYKCTDSATGKIVAIKVIRTEGTNSEQAIRRFHKEARILASIQNDNVTQLVEIGQIDSTPFIAMEFVHGIDLAQWLRNRMPLDEETALKAIRDIARALVEAHQRGIIHRDIKPENIMLAVSPNIPKEQIVSQLLCDCTLKLTDFGIAREIHQSQSMDVTRAGGILGTPRYMSPEQVKGDAAVGTATDIYALGITLFEILSGSVPYDDSDFIKIAAKHCFEPIPDIRRRNAKVSEATSQLISRMLAKKAVDRPATASKLIREIDAILAGVPNDFALHPVLPDFSAAHVWKRDFQWTLKSTPRELWPHVSNTERLNRAMGLAAVDYRVEVDPTRGVRRFGSFKIGGIKVEWEEHPFEWIEGTRFGVLREFASGPFKWFLSSVELQPISEGGTKLTHSVKIEPRNTLGRVVSEFEAGWKGGRALDRIYRRIDESIQLEQQGEHIWDRFEKDSMLSGSKLKRLESRVDRMISMGAELESTQKLSEYVGRAPLQEIAKIRPAWLATQLNLKPQVMVDTCLLGAAAGLLRIQWDIICPTCRVAAANENLLSSIRKHAHCEACDTEFKTSVADAIELTFQPHPEIRDTDTGKYCIGGPWHAPHVVTQVRLMPKERITLTVTLEAGDYLLRTVGSLNMYKIWVRPDGIELDPTFDIGTSPQRSTVASTLRDGRICLTLANLADVPKTVRLERTLERDFVVTAASVSGLPRFRELFPEQRFHQDLSVSSEELSVLVMQLHRLDAIYFSMGDEAAYEVAREALQTAESSVGQAGGSVVKHLDGGLIAIFRDCEQAVQAALDVLLSSKEKKNTSQLGLGFGLHRGKTLIAQQDGRNEYFGSTLRIAIFLATHADNAILATDSIAADPAVRELLTAQSLQVETRTLTSAGNTFVVQAIE